MKLSIVQALFFIFFSLISYSQQNTGTVIVSEEEQITSFGKLEISSTIAGQLLVDNVFIKNVNANTKFTLSGLTAGTHSIVLSGATPFSSTVVINANQTSYLTIVPQAANLGTIKVEEDEFSGKTGTIIDNRDNKTYKWVKIGRQIWMAENLAYQSTSGCYAYKNDESNVERYGYLYDYSTAQNACPEGWHLPAKNEFISLNQNLGVRDRSVYLNGIQGGNSGFDAVLGGRFLDGRYDERLELIGRYWSCTPEDGKHMWSMIFEEAPRRALIVPLHIKAAVSVRCVKD